MWHAAWFYSRPIRPEVEPDKPRIARNPGGGFGVAWHRQAALSKSIIPVPPPISKAVRPRGAATEFYDSRQASPASPPHSTFPRISLTQPDCGGAKITNEFGTFKTWQEPPFYKIFTDWPALSGIQRCLSPVRTSSYTEGAMAICF